MVVKSHSCNSASMCIILHVHYINRQLLYSSHQKIISSNTVVIYSYQHKSRVAIHLLTAEIDVMAMAQICTSG